MNIQKAYEMLKYSSSPENYLELRKLRLFSWNLVSTGINNLSSRAQ
jgi:hypothetical protein